MGASWSIDQEGNITTAGRIINKDAGDTARRTHGLIAEELRSAFFYEFFVKRAHAAFVATLGENAIWQQYLTA